MIKKTQQQSSAQLKAKPEKTALLPSHKTGRGKQQFARELGKENINSAQHIFKPISSRKKTQQLGFTHNTVSMIISDHQQSLLDSLLYEENANVLSSVIVPVEEEELLLDNCEGHYFSQIDEVAFSSSKKSKQKICDRSVVVRSGPPCALRVNRDIHNFTCFSLELDGAAHECNLLRSGCMLQIVLVRRLKALFKQDWSRLLSFYEIACGASCWEELQAVVRNYLFEHSIIFNKGELAEFTSALVPSDSIDCEQIGYTLELMFLDVVDGTRNLTQNINISQPALRQVAKEAYQGDPATSPSLWRFLRCALSGRNVSRSGVSAITCENRKSNPRSPLEGELGGIGKWLGLLFPPSHSPSDLG